MRLAIHSSFSTRTAEWSTSISTLASAVSVLIIMCKIVVIVPTGIVEHWTLTTVWMVTYLLIHAIRRVVSAAIRIAISWVATMLSTSLTLALLLRQVMWLIGLA